MIWAIGYGLVLFLLGFYLGNQIVDHKGYMRACDQFVNLFKKGSQ